MPHVEGHKQGETKPYSESKDFVPDPTAMTGTLDTSGTAGQGHERLEHITRVFDKDVTSPAEQEAVERAVELDQPTGLDDQGNAADLTVDPDNPNPAERSDEEAARLAQGTADTSEPGTPQTPKKSTAKKTAKKAAPAKKAAKKTPAKKAPAKKAPAKRVGSHVDGH